MPGYVVDRAAELLNTHAKPLNGARVLLLGVTYKRDIADQRESPARPIARKLLQRGAVLAYHDPFVDGWQVDGRDIPRAASPVTPADLTILLQAHTGYDLAEHRRRVAGCCSTPGASWPGRNVRVLPGSRRRAPLRVVVCTVVHHPADARILHRQIQALLDAGHQVTYIAPFGELEDFPERRQPSLTTVTIPRAVGRRRLGALRAAKAAMAAQMRGADLLLVHDPELLLVLPPRRGRPPTVWDVHEDTAAALTTKAWLPGWLRPAAAGRSQLRRTARGTPPAPHPRRARLQRHGSAAPTRWCPTRPMSPTRRLRRPGHAASSTSATFPRTGARPRWWSWPGCWRRTVSPWSWSAPPTRRHARTSRRPATWRGGTVSCRTRRPCGSPKGPWPGYRCCTTRPTSPTRCRPRSWSTWRTASRW